MRTLVFGRGQFAGFISDYFEDASVSQVDITKTSDVEAEIQKHKPDAVINTAAKTNIDWCEQNKLEAFNVNTLGAKNIYDACEKSNVFFCHISSGCMFLSRHPDEIYSEDDPPNPQCFYSWTKVWADQLLPNNELTLILRPRLVVSSKVDRRNTLAKWLTFSHFLTDFKSATILEDMLPVMKSMVERRISGTYNIVNEGAMSDFEAAHILKKKINPKLEINPVTLEEINKNLLARRVSTMLSTEKLKSIGYQLPKWDDSFPKIVDKFKKDLDAMGGLKALRQVQKDTKTKYHIVTTKPSTYKTGNRQ